MIAAHDEAAAIGWVVKGCRDSVPGLLEIVVIDDGSSDATADEAEAAGATVVRLPVNRGKGHAVRRGLSRRADRSSCSSTVTGRMTPRIRLLLAALSPAKDMVIGSRFLGRFGPRAITRIDWLGNRMLTAVLNTLFRVRITDSQAGFRAVRRAMLDRITLRAERYDIESDMLLQVLLAGGSVVEIPVSRAARRGGASGLSAVSRWVAHSMADRVDAARYAAQAPKSPSVILDRR